MRLIMRIRVSSATPTSPKNNRATHKHSHSVRAGACNFYYTYVHLVLSVFPLRGQASGRGLLFNCVGHMPGLAIYIFVQLQLIELAATHNENLHSAKIFLEFG